MNNPMSTASTPTWMRLSSLPPSLPVHNATTNSAQTLAPQRPPQLLMELIRSRPVEQLPNSGANLETNAATVGQRM